MVNIFSTLPFSLQCFFTNWQKFFACLPAAVAVNTHDQYEAQFVDILAMTVFTFQNVVCMRA